MSNFALPKSPEVVVNLQNIFSRFIVAMYPYVFSISNNNRLFKKLIFVFFKNSFYEVSRTSGNVSIQCCLGSENGAINRATEGLLLSEKLYNGWHYDYVWMQCFIRYLFFFQYPLQEQYIAQSISLKSIYVLLCRRRFCVL